VNCLDFRRLLLQDPFRNDADLLEHEAQCAQCATFAREQRAQETRLRAMLGEITPPPELAENIRLAVKLDRRGRSRRRVWYATAASVLLIVGATMLSLVTETWERGNMALAQSVLNHIDDEAHHLREAGPVTGQRVKFVFARFGARLNGDIGQVNFAAECLMRKRNGVHLVLPGVQGPITAFFMPGEHTERVLPVSSERFAGHVVPTAWGSIAVVGEHGEPLEGLAQKLAGAVEWPAPDSGLVGGISTAPLIAQQ